MTKNVFIVTAIAAIIGTSASAQNLIGRDTIAGDRNEDLIEAIEDDAERELDRFGNEGRPQGFTGSVALRGIVQSGNTDTTNVGIGTDMNYVLGPNGIELQLNYAYSDDDETDAEESLFYGLEYTRDLNPQFFGFAKLQGSADSATDAQFETDTFVSFGAGYRIYNESDVQWSVQAGPGYRFAELNDLTEGDVSEGAFGVSSDYAHKLSETVFVTNDTDVIWSESDTVVFNDLAVNVAMTETLALRTSILTEYHTEPADAEDTDNTFGVSLVYSFN
jgi:putative salt-induced outer membrane protein